MPETFYFDLVSDASVIRDEVGVGADSLDQALAEARAVIAEMSANDELPDDEVGWELAVRDSAGVERCRIRIR